MELGENLVVGLLFVFCDLFGSFLDFSDPEKQKKIKKDEELPER